MEKNKKDEERIEEFIKRDYDFEKEKLFLHMKMTKEVAEDLSKLVEEMFNVQKEHINTRIDIFFRCWSMVANGHLI